MQRCADLVITLESSFFSRRPPGTLLPDTTQKIPLPSKIDHFTDEKLPTFAFRRRLSGNQKNRSEMAKEITQRRTKVDRK